MATTPRPARALDEGRASGGLIALGAELEAVFDRLAAPGRRDAGPSSGSFDEPAERERMRALAQRVRRVIAGMVIPDDRARPGP